MHHHDGLEHHLVQLAVAIEDGTFVVGQSVKPTSDSSVESIRCFMSCCEKKTLSKKNSGLYAVSQRGNPSFLTKEQVATLFQVASCYQSDIMMPTAAVVVSLLARKWDIRQLL
jgi:hypothetical protein